MIKTVIIDDEERGRENLSALLRQYCPDVELIGTAHSVSTGLDVIRQMKPALVFLDIEMPFGNGFDLLEQAGTVDFDVVFTTAYDQYALKAIKFCALDYLLKPIDVDELVEAVEKVKKIDQQKNMYRNFNVLLNNLKSNGNGTRKLALPTADGLEFVEIDHIIRCEAVGNYTEFYLSGNNRFLSTKTLKQFEELLEGYNFFRAHHSHLINLNEILKYSKADGGYVTMSDHTTVTIAKRKKNEFLSRLLKT